MAKGQAGENLGRIIRGVATVPNGKRSRNSKKKRPETIGNLQHQPGIRGHAIERQGPKSGEPVCSGNGGSHAWVSCSLGLSAEHHHHEAVHAPHRPDWAAVRQGRARTPPQMCCGKGTGTCRVEARCCSRHTARPGRHGAHSRRSRVRGRCAAPGSGRGRCGSESGSAKAAGRSAAVCAQRRVISRRQVSRAPCSTAGVRHRNHAGLWQRDGRPAVIVARELHWAASRRSLALSVLFLRGRGAINGRKMQARAGQTGALGGREQRAGPDARKDGKAECASVGDDSFGHLTSGAGWRPASLALWAVCQVWRQLNEPHHP